MLIVSQQRSSALLVVLILTALIMTSVLAGFQSMWMQHRMQLYFEYQAKAFEKAMSAVDGYRQRGGTQPLYIDRREGPSRVIVDIKQGYFSQSS